MGFVYRVACDRVWTMWPLAPLLSALFVYMAGYASVWPFLVDILLSAICPGQVECSEVIFLSGVYTTVSGIGAVLVAPILGALSDHYGRKPVFLFVLSSSILPSLILAYSRERAYVYAWWGLLLIGHILREAGMFTLTFAFVADIVPEDRQRAPAIGVALSSLSFGMLAGTLLARGLGMDQVLKVAAVLQILSAVIVNSFLIESHPMHSSSNFLQVSEAQEDVDTEKQQQLHLPLNPEKGEEKSAMSMLVETILAVRSSKMLRIVAVVAFMVNITETTIQSTLFYYLKAVFDYGKDQFSLFMIIIGVVAFISQMAVYPILAHCVGERGVLWVGLLAASVNSYLYAFAWAPWVPYLACAFGVFYSLVPAAIGTIVSRGVGPEKQGKMQGLIVSVKTMASVIGPIIFTPLTAAFLSDDPPFHFPGFPLMIGGTAMIMAFFISLSLPRLPTPETCFETVLPTTDEDPDIIIVSTSERIESEEKGPEEP
ncbi:hypothetical protein R1flu_015595 [Riccia fluitans]|uniref:Major facilitator superfamily (MFS) profile domain-containing protein n=1 Tax=Riccia fluitans TaxID=41844 RepID=A0ABD1YMK9_9MARC